MTVNTQERFRVLIVDDEPGIRKILRMFLEMEGYEVFEAATAGQAMEIVKLEKPHMAILDILLDDRTGFDVCEWIKSNPETRKTKVLLFTALGQEHEFREGQRVGCDYYLTKPQNPKDIIEKVREYLHTEVSQS